MKYSEVNYSLFLNLLKIRPLRNLSRNHKNKNSIKKIKYFFNYFINWAIPKKGVFLFIDRKNQYRYELDGLRALAILAVIIHHLNKALLPSGFLGVDIFFVISGYVITSSSASKQYSNFKKFTLNFYKKRIKKIMPSLILYVLILSLLISFFSINNNGRIYTGISSLFGVSNIALFMASKNYFAENINMNPFVNTWSLSVEIQFYLCFPFIIWLTRFRNKNIINKKIFPNVLIFISLISFIAYIFIYTTNRNAGYYLLPYRFWEFGLGSILFIFLIKNNSFIKKINKLNPKLIVLMILLTFLIPVKFLLFSTVFIVFLTLLLIINFKNDPFIFSIFTDKKVVYIGLISYSLYLWHWGIISISRWTIGINFWTVPLILLIIFSTSVISHRFVELPCMGSDKSTDTKFILKSFYWISLSMIPLLGLTEIFKNKLYLGNFCKPTKFNTCKEKAYPHEPITPYIENTTIKRDLCFYQTKSSWDNYYKCIVKPKSKEKTIFALGSSTVHHFSPVFNEIHNKYGLGIALITYPACDLDITFQNKKLVMTNFKKVGCQEFNRFRWKLVLEKIKRGDIIYLGFTPRSLDEKYKKSIEELAIFADKNEINVIFQSPIFKVSDLKNIYFCINAQSNWFNSKQYVKCKEKKNFKKETLKNQFSELLIFLEDLSKKYYHFNIYKLDDIYCDEYKCSSHKKNIRILRDNSYHVSLPAAKDLISPHFINYLKFKQFLN